MKQLIILLLFIPLVSFGQERVNEYDIYTTRNTEKQEKIVVQSKTNVSNKTIVPRELILSEQKTTIKTPLTVDLSNYTHLLLVIVDTYRINEYLTSSTQLGFKDQNRIAYKPVENILKLGIFEVINPIEYDRKRFKKEPDYLRTIKKDSYLYLYGIQTKGRGDDVNSTIIVRDSKNKIIYNANHINTGLNEILEPLIDH